MGDQERALGDQERALGYADICDRPYLHENIMRPPSFIVKYSSDLCPNILLRIRFRFLFSTLFSRDPPLSRQEKLENTDIVVASLPSDFHRFLLLRAERIFAPSFT